MSFTSIVQEKVAPYWEGSLRHPFIVQLQAGTLPEEIFRYYLIQDHYYLRYFRKLHQIVSDRCQDQELKALMTLSATGLKDGEMIVREQFFEALKITADEVQETPVAPTTDHYIAHKYRQLFADNPAIAAAGLYPCAWLYSDIGMALSQQPASPNPYYQRWIETYTKAELQDEIQMTGIVLNRLYASSSADDQVKMVQAFVRSSQLEYHFWEMAYRKEQWLRGDEYDEQ